MAVGGRRPPGAHLRPRVPPGRRARLLAALDDPAADWEEAENQEALRTFLRTFRPGSG
ncbi:hypothetical protein ACR6C2_43810 [Streptomyces sp. INA 01156]